MNIYFVGIGGVGLGPLAEIALDAGHRVFGTDNTEGLMTRHLASRGITVSTDQSGDFLRKTHSHTPIDWLVYSSGIPLESPELVAASELGIIATKRDALLSQIIREKGLRLIAIAGTHGKTTTTGMFVWALKQLDVPVSYSIGTTISFGPSGHYEPGSKYFVYECDEFDRNFLEFHSNLSLITSVDYDHPDTYPTKDDYSAAFSKFISQSGHTIIWQKDAQNLKVGESSWVLSDGEVASVTLPGLHNRQNATLVAKGFEYLNIEGDVISALNTFPGTDRRFEKITEGVYSDYGHHPVEIAATLELARELAEDVVLVYQPHQNVRQHEILDQYTDCFKDASKVYWLPTYLTREDANLPILTPQELSQNVSNKRDVHFAELNNDLWFKLADDHKNGALILCMGAGTIDEWARKHLADLN